METTNLSPDMLKQMVKEALSETLTDQKDFFRGIIEEVLEDYAFAEAIREGQQTEIVSRDEVFDVLNGKE